MKKDLRYAGIIYNDIAAAPGVCLSFYVQGCPHHCEGCFNPETWDFTKGKIFDDTTLSAILKGLTANGVQRSLCILGGEPLCPQNLELTNLVITKAKEKYPDLNVYIWTGYLIEDILNIKDNPLLNNILKFTDVIVDGPFEQDKRDITLQMRGSSNQRIIKFINEKSLEIVDRI